MSIFILIIKEWLDFHRFSGVPNAYALQFLLVIDVLLVITISQLENYLILHLTHVVDARKSIRSYKKSAPILFINTPGEGML